MHIRLMLALCWCLLFMVRLSSCKCCAHMYVYVRMRLEWNYQLLSSPLILLSLTTKNFKHQSNVGLTTVDKAFPHWQWTFSLPCLFFLPDSPIYWPQQLREGLWRDINEKKHTEIPAGTWTQEKREYKLFQEEDRLCFTATYDFCSDMLHEEF